MNKLKKWWKHTGTWQQLGLGLGLILLVFLVFSFGLRLAYTNKILPGVRARSIDLGGLTEQDAKKLLDERTEKYLTSTLLVTYAQNQAKIQPTELGVNFDNSAVAKEAFNTGRDADIITDLANQTLLVLGLYDQSSIQVGFDKDKISSFFYDRSNEIASSAQNAHYEIFGPQLNVAPNTIGHRLDLGQSTLSIGEAVSNLQDKVALASLNIIPARNVESLNRQRDSVNELTQQPISLTYADKSWSVSRQQLLDWLGASNSVLPYRVDLLNSYYHVLPELSDFKLERSLVLDYVKSLAQEIDRSPVDAKLTISGGKAVIFKQSRNGQSVDIENTTDSIINTITNKKVSPVELVVKTIKAEVSDDNIEKLGIKELISEGITYFPGSPANRLQNVRVGMSKFNGVLLKPNQVFSFGEILGEVGPAQGYTPGLIILGDHEEKAYGGGLCQVSSTAYRAALLAGLPILQRTNHAFAISYYTAPYGVPGVDATIYYPQVDMKFRNDTGSYMLIQTEMIGTTLRFRYYGTKTKSGAIRGPFFVTGSSDATKPSQTVFYRDVLDLNGKVTKTDTISTYYQSSLDFPITD